MVDNVNEDKPKQADQAVLSEGGEADAKTKEGVAASSDAANPPEKNGTGEHDAADSEGHSRKLSDDESRRASEHAGGGAERHVREGLLSRFFLMRDRLDAAKAEAHSITGAATQSLSRAQKAQASAEALLGAQPINAPDDFASANLLLREALYWTACAVESWRERTPSTLPPSSFEEAWRALTAREAPLHELDSDSAARARIAFVERGLFEARALSEVDAIDETRALRKAAETAISSLEKKLNAERRLRRSRALRWATPIALFLAGGAVGLLGIHQARATANYALRKPVETSSTWGKYRTTSGVVDGVTTGVGFHTNSELRPWVQVDLGSVMAVSEVEVYNSDHCCFDRVVPLVVTVSADGKHYRQVARKDEVFAEWTASFPEVQARYVKLYVDRKEYFHLSEIKVR